MLICNVTLTFQDQLTQDTSCLAENLEAPHLTRLKSDTCTG